MKYFTNIETNIETKQTEQFNFKFVEILYKYRIKTNRTVQFQVCRHS